MVQAQGLEPLQVEVAADAALVELGEALFFDRELSGNRNMSCATCHHPLFASGDGLSLSIGQNGVGLGPERIPGEGGVIPRNANDLFNRGASEWTTMFWDSRVSGTPEEGFVTPAGDDTPAGLDSVLAAQALFPVESHGEMRGNAEDVDVAGRRNELAGFPDDDFLSVWDAIVARLQAIPAYDELFAAAFPEVPSTDLGIEHVANAIGAYEATAFAFPDSPWSAYLAGDDEALSEAAIAGAVLFLGEAGCSTCHSGVLLTDQQTHSLGVPQVGPGKDEEGPEDFGRGRETGRIEDRYTFRTPSLHNVTITGPWTHDGAYTTLENVIRHHIDPAERLLEYDVTQTVGPGLLVLDRQRHLDPIVASISPELDAVPALSDDQIADLIAFLNSLTDPAATDLGHLVPESVPSGLPVDR
ncbi:MAG: cytochrome c peroxidase [Actinomycetota bacterium]|nr:cytochrome c peroxidase [Actinomycetota bacterium]